MERNIGNKGKERNFANYSNNYYNSYDYISSYFNTNTYDKRVSSNSKICSRICWIKKRSWNEKNYKFKNAVSQMQTKVFTK